MSWGIAAIPAGALDLSNTASARRGQGTGGHQKSGFGEFRGLKTRRAPRRPPIPELSIPVPVAWQEWRGRPIQAKSIGATMSESEKVLSEWAKTQPGVAPVRDERILGSDEKSQPVVPCVTSVPCPWARSALWLREARWCDFLEFPHLQRQTGKRIHGHFWIRSGAIISRRATNEAASPSPRAQAPIKSPANERGQVQGGMPREEHFKH